MEKASEGLCFYLNCQWIFHGPWAVDRAMLMGHRCKMLKRNPYQTGRFGRKKASSYRIARMGYR
jgi:hypothetical protein